ncbi:probable bifunctional dTTP/UTP pyrophosphatase/methyltransferase protein isoform X3 [Phacochoerus africanus]|uniref:probable bifunctional dTTP/UTP pyrophosphatase/methyltransferase protein isoform X3 n=1 Tax=Phacochoerus africanus TaxID=41426 RepID=UPI001FD8A6C4|nr:probable bifunctional dTTP/UTP pyrophosphatase/methyltransferase protein isoform X3 [Phacochoerus africanus]
MVLCPVIGKLLQKHVVLASASPRRQEILSNAKDLRAPDVVIGADTIVAVEGLILEKPVDKQDAYRMLSRLSGKEHSVFTGVAIVHCCSHDGQLDTHVSDFHEETRVKFSELSEELLWEYIDSGEPMDKAGGYGIQALGGMLVEHVCGDFLNVVGFPLNRFCKELARLYYPPRAQDVQRLKHDSIPAVDTFEDLSDAECGGPDPAGSHEGGRGGEKAGERPQALGAPHADLNGAAENRPSFPTGLLELMGAFKASKALFTACKLQVFDVLQDQGPLKAADVARRIDASTGGTERLLDACVALGLLDRTDRGYSNTEAATLHLVSDGEHSLHGLAVYHDDHVWDLLTHLDRAVREGAGPTHRALGAMQAEPLCQDAPHEGAEGTLRFMRAAHGLSTLTARHVATAFDLSRFSSACDLGGCTGALARELAQEYPRLEVTVFDRPEVIELARRFQPKGPQTGRIRFLPGRPPGSRALRPVRNPAGPAGRQSARVTEQDLKQLQTRRRHPGGGSSPGRGGGGGGGGGGADPPAADPEPQRPPAAAAATRLPGRAGGAGGGPAARAPGHPGRALRAVPTEVKVSWRQGAVGGGR